MSSWYDDLHYRVGAACVIVVVVATAAFAALYYFHPPNFYELRVTNAVVTGPVRIERSAKGPSWMTLSTDKIQARIHNISLFQDCILNCDSIALELKPGDRITLWTKGDVIWQLQGDQRMLIKYIDAVEADHRWTKRAYSCVVILTMICGLLAIWKAL